MLVTFTQAFVNIVRIVYLSVVEIIINSYARTMFKYHLRKFHSTVRELFARFRLGALDYHRREERALGSGRVR